MKASISCYCPFCKKYGNIVIKQNAELLCPFCSQTWGKIIDPEKIFEQCPVCQCRQFYTSKDFNQFLGCCVLSIGIILVPWTYGLSLPVFALVDWMLHKRVPTIINCYKCGSEFRCLPAPKHLKPFMHHIGLKYDKYR